MRWIGPIVHVLITKASTFIQVARVVRIVDKTGSKELTSIPKCW